MRKVAIHFELACQKIAQSEPSVLQQSLVNAPEASKPLLEVDIDPFLHQLPYFSAPPTDPILLEIGD